MGVMRNCNLGSPTNSLSLRAGCLKHQSPLTSIQKRKSIQLIDRTNQQILCFGNGYYKLIDLYHILDYIERTVKSTCASDQKSYTKANILANILLI